jgi:hypothetical protein
MTQNQKILASICGFIVLAGLTIAIIWQWTGSPNLGAVDPLQIKHAVLAYLRDIAAERKTPPQSIKLEELIKKGYLKDEFVKGFEGMDVTIYLQNDQPTNAFMTVRLPSGGSMSLLNDGSIKNEP